MKFLNRELNQLAQFRVGGQRHWEPLAGGELVDGEVSPA